MQIVRMSRVRILHGAKFNDTLPCEIQYLIGLALRRKSPQVQNVYWPMKYILFAEEYTAKNRKDDRKIAVKNVS